MASINPFLPVQEGTGDPSPENVRPIKPAVSIAGGKNLYNSVTDTVNAYIGANEQYKGQILSGTGYRATDYISVSPNTEYTINYNSTSTAAAAGMVYFASKNANDILGSISLHYQTYIPRKQYYTFTTPNNCHYIRFSMFPGAYDVQLEEGSEPTSYEPYQSLDVYGGYLDIANSRIVEEWDYKEYNGSESWTKGTDGSAKDFMMKIALPTSASFSVTNLLSNYLQTIADNARWGNYDNWISFTAPNTINTGIQSITTVEDWSTYLTSHHLQVVYKPRNSITHTLSPTQLAQAMEQLGIKLSSTLIDIRRKILLNSPHLETASGSIASFKTDMKAPLKECKIHFLPVQSGSGDPSPTNIRPINGWTGLNACLTGNNIWDEVLVQGPLGSSGNIIDGASRRTTSFIPVKGGSTYYFCGPNKAAYGRIAYYDKDKNPIYVDTSTGIPTGILTARDGACYMRVTLGAPYGTVYGNDISFNYPSSDTVYHAHEGNEIQQVSFGENGTIYGGYVDLVSGELVVEWEVASGLWGDIKSGSPNSTTGFYQGTLRISRRIKGCHIQSEYGTNAICNVIGTVRWEGAGTSPEHFFSGNDDSGGIFYIYCNYDDSQEIQVAAKLETPITYQLTPQQLKSLKGINNIWSDTNDAIEIKYWTH